MSVALRARRAAAGRRLLGLSVAQSYAKLVQADGAIAYWRLGETSGTTASDVMGAHPGTYVGTPTLGAAGALADDTNAAVTFAQTGHVDSPASFPMPLSECSIEWWQRDATAVEQYTFAWNGVSTTNRASCHAPWSNGNFYFDFGDITAAPADRIEFVPAFQAGWNHIVCVASASQGRMAVYINGALAHEATGKSPGLTSVSSPLSIGAQNDDTRQQSGSMDEFAVYDRALTAEQIRRHYWRGKGYTDYPLEVLVNGPVGYWRLGEPSGATSLASAVGTGKDFTTLNAVTLGVVGAIANDTDTAASFNGTSSYADTPDHADWDLGSNFSMEAWVKTSVTGAYQQILDRDGATRNFQFRIHNTNVGHFIGFWGGVNQDVTGSTAVTDGVWHHIAATYDGAYMRLYTDGALEYAKAQTGALDAGTIGLRLGAYSGAGAQYFSGSIDEPAIYQTVLTPTQIEERYYLGLGQPVPAPTLVGAVDLTAADAGSAISGRWYGYDFKVASALLAYGGRVKVGGTAATVTVALWEVGVQTKLKSTTVTTTPDAWVSVEFDAPVRLDPAKTYYIGVHGAFNRFVDLAPADRVDARITIANATRWGTVSVDAFPTSTATDYYGFADVLLSQ